jgi:hypothetical protein
MMATRCFSLCVMEAWNSEERQFRQEENDEKGNSLCRRVAVSLCRCVGVGLKEILQEYAAVLSIWKSGTKVLICSASIELLTSLIFSS